jgi:GTP-binding protein YchF
MALQIGIVGLPNVGKSTLFNAITKSSQAAAENFPFCTIDPNVGMVEVPDKRLDALAKIVQPEKILHSTIEFVDIAGLVEGASKGEGLGNKFLANIRDCDAIAMVVRFFEDGGVHHVSGKVDPKADKEVIELELILADLETVEKALAKAERDAKSGKKEGIIRKELCTRLKPFLESEKPVREFEVKDEDEALALASLHLLSAKPQLYIVNLSEDDFVDFDEEIARKKLAVSNDAIIVPICAKTECDLIDFSEEEANEMMEALGMEESGLDTLIRSAFTLLELESYFTAGVQEVRAWTIKKGSSAPKAAGVIHTDFEKKFIKGEVCSVEDFVQYSGWSGVRENGALRLEGKDAIIKDGDVCMWKIGG